MLDSEQRQQILDTHTQPPDVAREIGSNVLEIIKGKTEAMTLEDIYDRSRSDGQIESVGKLSSLSDNLTFKGPISLKRRLDSGEITTDMLERAIKIMTECYVEVTPDMPYRCGDGRSALSKDELSSKSLFELAVQPLGPQAMGAAQTHGMAHRLVSEHSESVTLLEDIEASSSSLRDTGVRPALHTDNHDHSDGRIGCGAVNTQAAGIDAYDNDMDEGLSVLGANIAGENYSEKAHREHKDKARLIPDNYMTDGKELLEGLRKTEGEQSTQYVTDDHLEGLVGVNKVPNTTFNRELYLKRCDIELGVVIQAFNIDTWKFSEVAEHRFPDDEYKQNEYITACADWQARPAAFLTDGSLDVVVRAPRVS